MVSGKVLICISRATATSLLRMALASNSSVMYECWIATAACAANAGPTHSSCSSNCPTSAPSHCMTPNTDSSRPTIGTFNSDRVSPPGICVGYLRKRVSSRHSCILLIAVVFAHLPAQPSPTSNLVGVSVEGTTITSCPELFSSNHNTPVSATIATLPTSMISRNSSGIASGAARRCIISRILTSDSRVISFG